MNRRALGIVDEQHGLQACARQQGTEGSVSHRGAGSSGQSFDAGPSP